MFEKHLSKEEREINKIRFKSRKRVDKSNIFLSKNSEFKRYIRMIESFILDSELNPKKTFYNFEIKKITSY